MLLDSRKQQIEEDDDTLTEMKIGKVNSDEGGAEMLKDK